MHVPLPHPPSNETTGDLLKDREHNLGESARLTTRLIERLPARFADDFTLIIQSDHALRVALWSHSRYFRAAGCGEKLPRDSQRVRLIVAGPRPVHPVPIETSVGVLASASATQ